MHYDDINTITYPLNIREYEILHLKAQGYTAKEVARMVGLHYRTIEIYVGHILRKLEAKNITNALYIMLTRQ